MPRTGPPRSDGTPPALPAQRQPTRIRQVEKCSTCAKIALGNTTIEHRPWDKEEPHRAFHFCDDCRDAIAKRPLAEVLEFFVDSASPHDGRKSDRLSRLALPPTPEPTVHPDQFARRMTPSFANRFANPS